MNNEESLKTWARRMGYKGNLGPTVKFICNASSAHIWSQVVERVRPANEIERKRRCILMNTMKNSNKVLDTCIPTELQLFERKQFLKHEINKIKAKIEEKEKEIDKAEVSLSNTEESLCNVNENIKNIETMTHLYKIKSLDLQETLKKQTENLQKLRSNTSTFDPTQNALTDHKNDKILMHSSPEMQFTTLVAFQQALRTLKIETSHLSIDNDSSLGLIDMENSLNDTLLNEDQLKEDLAILLSDKSALRSYIEDFKSLFPFDSSSTNYNIRQLSNGGTKMHVLMDIIRNELETRNFNKKVLELRKEMSKVFNQGYEKILEMDLQSTSIVSYKTLMDNLKPIGGIHCLDVQSTTTVLQSQDHLIDLYKQLSKTIESLRDQSAHMLTTSRELKEESHKRSTRSVHALVLMTDQRSWNLLGGSLCTREMNTWQTVPLEHCLQMTQHQTMGNNQQAADYSLMTSIANEETLPRSIEDEDGKLMCLANDAQTYWYRLQEFNDGLRKPSLATRHHGNLRKDLREHANILRKHAQNLSSMCCYDNSSSSNNDTIPLNRIKQVLEIMTSEEESNVAEDAIRSDRKYDGKTIQEYRDLFLRYYVQVGKYHHKYP